MRVIVCALSLFLVPQTVAAPMPLPRHTKAPATVEQLFPRDMAGDWVMTWGGGEWKVSLSAFGTYVASRESQSIWAGTWYMDGPGSLHVSEAWMDENGQRGSEMFWSAVWQRGKDGRFDTRSLSGVVRRPDGSSSTSITLVRSPRPKGK